MIGGFADKTAPIFRILHESEAVHFLAGALQKQKKPLRACSVFCRMLALADDFRTIDWVKEYPYPEKSLREIRSLLAR